MSARDKLKSLGCIAASVASLAGCTHNEVHYFGETGETQHYLDRATKVDFADVENESLPEVNNSIGPRTVASDQKDAIWDLPLGEAIRLGLQNSRIIRSRAAFLSPGNSILNSAERTASIYDPSIQESGVLFGGRGVESALAAFDTNFKTDMRWRRNETVSNSFTAGTPPVADESSDENADFSTSLRKSFAHGGSMRLFHDVNYFGNPVGGANSLFGSAYSGSVGAEYRHPLLAGSGTEFTRIAGPIGESFGGLTGVSQGVVIARINNDITISDLEAALTTYVKDVQDAYWDLYLQYRLFDTSVAARNSAERTLRDASLKKEFGGAPNFTLEDEAQARDRYYETQALAKQAQSSIYQAETALRRLIGLAVNDGKVIRPLDEPISARIQPDWAASVADAFTRRVELRKQKWQLKSLELQLLAAENLVRPRFDFVSGYQLNGFGDKLLDHDDRDTIGTRQSLNSFYETVTQGNQTGWNAGFVFEMPIGLRQARSQVRNVELRLAKARDVLAASELEISHEIANAYQSLAETYAVTQENLARREAAMERVRLTDANQRAGKQTIDMVLRAQASHAEANVAYFRALVAYTQAITNLQFREGTLLAESNVFMAENEWSKEAYELALRRARDRSTAISANKSKTTLPGEFVVSGYETPQQAETTFAIPLPPDTGEAVQAEPAAAPNPEPPNIVPILPPTQPPPLLNPQPEAARTTTLSQPATATWKKTSEIRHTVAPGRATNLQNAPTPLGELTPAPSAL